MATFADRVKELRKKKGLTQSQLAEAIGVASMTVSIWERGIRRPEFERLDNICEFFDVSLGYLLGDDDVSRGYFSEDNGEGALALYYEDMEQVLNHLLKLSEASRQIIISAIATAYKIDKESGNLENPQYTAIIRKNSSGTAETQDGTSEE